MDRRGAALATMGLAAAALAATGCGGKPEDLTELRSALTLSDVMGLETAGGWSTTTAGARLSQSTTHDQGSFSLRVDPSTSNGYTPITSVPLGKPVVIGPKLAFDVMLPTAQANPNWLGTVQIYVNCPSRAIYSAFLAQVELTGKPLGVWNSVSFPLTNATIAPLLNGGYTDLTFTLVLNVAVPARGPYFIDNLRFLPAGSTGCGGLPDGTFCDDANACTTGETCHAGACGASTAVSCAAPDACHTQAACVPATGCPAPVAKPNGTACSDSNACTTGESCQGGVCGGGSAVSCVVPDSCHTQGACVPATGCPAAVVKPNGAACDDGDACTTADVCTAGTCAGAHQGACAITPVVDWAMAPHFPGLDGPPPFCTLPPEFPPVVINPPAINLPFECTAGGVSGCGVEQVSTLPFGVGGTTVVKACTAQPCVAGTATGCTLQGCGHTGVRRCNSQGGWGPCTGFERCNGIDDDCDGAVDEGNVCQLPLSLNDPAGGPGWDANLIACASTATGGTITRFIWDVTLPTGVRHIDTTSCKTPFVFPSEGTFTATLTVVTQSGLRTALTAAVTIKDHLIVSMGDSIASGEGNPDIEAQDNGGVPVWQSKRCHRSMQSLHALAALQLENADPQSSVTFRSFACSGASIGTGILGSYEGIEPDGTTELPQLTQAQNLLAGSSRGIDALLMQVGANNVLFGPEVEACAIPSFSRPSDETLALLVAFAGFPPDVALSIASLPTDDLFTCARTENELFVIDPLLNLLADSGYPGLNTQLRSHLPLNRPNGIYIAEYPDPTFADDGTFCNEIRIEGAIADNVIPLIPPATALFIPDAISGALTAGILTQFVDFVPDGVVSHDEASWMHAHYITPLNSVIANTAGGSTNWTFIGNINTPARFGRHGYCATPATRWFRHRNESLTIQLTQDGTLHPNRAGHAAYAVPLFNQLAADLAN